MHRVVASVTVLLLLLTGCGSADPAPSGLPTIEASTDSSSAPSTPTPTASLTPDPSPWTALPTVDVGPNKGVHNGVVLGSSVAKTAQEKAAVEAFVAFWAFGYRSGSNVKINRAEVAKVASGAPVTNMESYVERLRAKGARTIGWASLNVTSIAVGQRSILIKACIDNGSFDVDRTSGKRLEQTPIGYDTTAAVRNVDGRLVVTSSGVDVRKKSCPVRR